MNYVYQSTKINGVKVPFHAYGSHQHVLLREALTIPEGGTIIETGCGFYSTPLLYEVAVAKGGTLISYVEDMEWAKHFAHLQGAEYRQVKVNFDKFPTPEECDMAFVDHERAPKLRLPVLEKVLEVAGVVVAHDAEWIDLSRFDAEVDKWLRPHTAIVRK